MPRKSLIRDKGLGTEIQWLRMNGNTHEKIKDQINEKHDITLNRRQVSRYLESLNDNDLEPTKDAIRLEINQENAVSELSNQLSEYTANYNEAMNRLDEKAGFGWSRNRLDILEKMLKVTGLYDRAKKDAQKEIVSDHSGTVIDWSGSERTGEEVNEDLTILIQILEDESVVPSKTKIAISERLLELGESS